MEGDAGEGGSPAEFRPLAQPSSSRLTAGAWDDNLNFERFLAYRQSLERVPGALPLSEEQHVTAHDAMGQKRGARETLDVAFVVDTTGSMGDEIRYLQAEFTQISNTIQVTYPNADARWSLIVYRDLGDEYVTKVFDFTSDAASFRASLVAQSAGGGGDIPEAPDVALTDMAELDWRTEATTARLAFWVADAPHHDGDEGALASAVSAAEALDVHIYPVASSGIDELTELTMRSAAQLTGGRYLFLTDDSGVGGPHKEPTIPCYFVTKLDSAILRMVDIELTGIYREPPAAEIIRTGGDPREGACHLGDDDTVFVF